MLEHIPHLPGTSRIASDAPNAPKKNSAPAQGAAFQALIEKLEAQARELEQQSRTVESPADLSGAVDRAHASLQDVLALSDGLLEAYRSALQSSTEAAKSLPDKR